MYLSIAWLAQFWDRGSRLAVPNEPDTHIAAGRQNVTVRETPAYKVQAWRREHGAQLYEGQSHAQLCEPYTGPERRKTIREDYEDWLYNSSLERLIGPTRTAPQPQGLAFED